MKGLILFGHGARDPQWREPFDQLVKLWQKENQAIPVKAAFLERMQPDLKTAIGELSQLGSTEIKIVPVFFGQGGHLREDLPVLLQDCAKQFPQISLSTSPAVGECEEVLQAILGFAKNQLL